MDGAGDNCIGKAEQQDYNRRAPVKNTRHTEPATMQDALATAEVLVSLGQSEAQAIAKEFAENERIEFAKGLCAAVLSRFWDILFARPPQKNRSGG